MADVDGLAAFGGRVPVCLRCGDRDVREQTIGDGLFPGGGEGTAWTCDRCGYQGQVLLVDPADLEATRRDVPAPLATVVLDRPGQDRALGFFLVAAAFVFLAVGLGAVLLAFAAGRAGGVLAAFLGAGVSAAFALAFGRVGLRHLKD